VPAEGARALIADADARGRVLALGALAALTLGLVALSGARRRPAALGIPGFLLAVAGAVVYLDAQAPGQWGDPLAGSLALDRPNDAVRDARGNLYLVDASQRRLVALDPEGRLRYRAAGGSREEGRFFYVWDLAADDRGQVYLLNLVSDDKGFYAEREEILRLTSEGRFAGVIYRKVFTEAEHRPELVQRGEVMGLGVQGRHLLWFRVDADGIRAYRHDLDTGATAPPVLHTLAGADQRVAHVAADPAGGFVYTDKTGELVRVAADGTRSLVWRAADPRVSGGQRIVPWEVGIDGSGRVYFVDLEGRAVRRVEGPGASRVVLDRTDIEAALGAPVGEFDYYRLSVGPDGSLVTCNDEAVVVRDASGAVRYLTAAQLTSQWRAWVLSLWLVGAVLLLLVLWGTSRAYVALVGRTLPPLLLWGGAVLAIAVLSAAIAAHTVGEGLSERHQTAVLERISAIISLAPGALDAERFAGVQEQQDFGNADYLHIRDQLLRLFHEGERGWSESYYFALYRVLDGRLYGFMYMNGRINTFYPYEWLTTEGVYDRALRGEVATEASTDIAGDWIYGVGPVRDAAGRVVALIETGTDLYSLRLENRAIAWDLTIRLASALLILVLVLVEAGYLVDALRRRQRAPPALAGAAPEAMLARPLAFLLFAAVSVSLAFMPLLAAELYHPIDGLSRDLVLALPISVEMFAFGLATIAGGALTARSGWRRTFYLGLLVAAIGLLVSAAARDLYVLGLGRGLTGLGSGLTFMALRALVNRERQPEARGRAFAQFYAGMTGGIATGAVLGGALADALGYAPVFLVGAGLVLLSAVLAVLVLQTKGAGAAAPRTAAGAAAPRPRRALAILLGPRNLGFFLLIIFPTYIAAAFIVYYFPLFAEGQGLSTRAIGLFILLGALCVIYLGPVFSAYLERTLGAYRSMILGSILWGLALVLFAVTGSLAGAVIAILLMGIAEGFDAVAQNEVFLRSRVVADLGEDRALGYFEFLGKVGETLGPLVFAAAVGIGVLAGPLAIGAVVIAGALVFALVFGDQGTARTEPASVPPRPLPLASGPTAS
jgi:predicted MFS family arabinose efflux permease